MKFQFIRKQPSQQNDFKCEVQREKLRQSRWNYNLAFGTVVTSFGVVLLGVGLLYLGKIKESKLTSTSGTISSFVSILFTQTRKNELQKLIQELDEKDGA